MKRILVSLATAAMLPTLALASSAVADRGGRPDAYILAGDSGGSKFEGIGTDLSRSDIAQVTRLLAKR